MVELFEKFWEALTNVLPLSPFAGTIADLSIVDSEWLGYLNFFFPVSGFLTLMLAWLAAIAIYYIYSAIMRWIGVIA